MAYITHRRGAGSTNLLINLCPSGTGLGTGVFNGTILLICDAAFNKVTLSSEEALGLGFGLGLPLLFLLVLFGIHRWRVKIEHQEFLKQIEIQQGRYNDEIN